MRTRTGLQLLGWVLAANAMALATVLLGGMQAAQNAGQRLALLCGLG